MTPNREDIPWKIRFGVILSDNARTVNLVRYANECRSELTSAQWRDELRSLLQKRSRYA